jgi:SAM-dependent methyltransferase
MESSNKSSLMGGMKRIVPQSFKDEIKKYITYQLGLQKNQLDQQQSQIEQLQHQLEQQSQLNQLQNQLDQLKNQLEQQSQLLQQQSQLDQQQSQWLQQQSQLEQQQSQLLQQQSQLEQQQSQWLQQQNQLEQQHSQLEQQQSQGNDNEVLLQQTLSILYRGENIPPPPPKHLQNRVVGGYVSGFIESGFTSVYPDLSRALKPVGKELKDFESILDFGCGCGRAIRALATLLPDSKLYGTDIDDEAIAWLKANYSRFAEFSVAPHLPPTIYEDESFNFIYGISVLTHLPEDMQFQWLSELARITKPNGYLVLTTHGENHYKAFVPEVLKIMDEKGFFYCDPGFNYGKSVSLPDFYQNAFHTHAYIEREWSQYFDVIEIQPLGIGGHQDTVLLQKRA